MKLRAIRKDIDGQIKTIIILFHKMHIIIALADNVHLEYVHMYGCEL